MAAADLLPTSTPCVTWHSRTSVVRGRPMCHPAQFLPVELMMIGAVLIGGKVGQESVTGWLEASERKLIALKAHKGASVLSIVVRGLSGV